MGLSCWPGEKKNKQKKISDVNFDSNFSEVNCDNTVDYLINFIMNTIKTTTYTTANVSITCKKRYLKSKYCNCNTTYKPLLENEKVL